MDKLDDETGNKRGWTSLGALLAIVVLLGLGERMAERFIPIYLLALGGGVFSIGLFNGGTNLLNALYSFPGGYLSDKLGYKRALLIFNLIAMVGYLIVVLVPRWWAVLVGAVFFLSWTAVSLPASMSLVSKAMPRSRRTLGVSLHSLVRRLPMAVGPIIGGALIVAYGTVTGVRLAFGLAIVLGLVSIVVQQRLIHEEPGSRGCAQSPLKLMSTLRGPLRNLLVSDILIRFCEQIPYAFVVVWVMQGHGLSSMKFGVLTAVEMITAAIVYLPVAFFADRSTKKPFVMITFVFFTLFPIALLLSRSYTAFFFTFVLRGMKEFGEPTRKALIMDLAPEECKAGTFGLYYLIRDVIVSVAAFGGAWLWQLGPAINLWTAFGCGVAGTACFALFGGDLIPGKENGRV
jgi:MFS family permease